MAVWTSTQRPHRVADVNAQMLHVDRGRVRVITPDVGGGFGPKGNVYPEEIVVAWLAFTLDRPVKWIQDRREHFLTTLHERDQVHLTGTVALRNRNCCRRPSGSLRQR